MMRRQSGMPFDMTGFLGNLKFVYFRKPVEVLITSYEKLGYICHSRCNFSIQNWFPFRITGVP
jgi:hypothetical protein